MLRGKIFVTSMFLVGMLFLFRPVDTTGQDLSIQRTHALSKVTESPSAVPTTGALNLIAVMVEFQPDSNRLTSGTGVFGNGGLPYLERNPTNIDPLPHNQAYFEAHLEFARNYFEQSSDGQLTLNYRVLPDVYQLDHPMEYYSPTGESFTNEKLAYLARDTWAKVEAAGGFDATGLDPDETGFMIFHAGVGRDIELVGTTLDITPQDIPSVYLGTTELSQLLNDSAFNGFSMNGGSFRVTNTMILPRTESRRGLDIQDNEFVFPLSINGLLAASIGNHLGLPDLFNPQNGESGIGRFGLMDGAGIFAYNGLFPPEPSAWEKQHMGWITPFEIETGSVDSVYLDAGSLNSPNSVARYSLSSSEYFLVENRHRDPEGDGIELTIRRNDGTEVTQRFLNTNDVFVNQQNGFDDLFETGVVINADNFDWALPGGYDIGADETEGTSDDRELNGGILIWHIDEAAIANSLIGVNGYENNRGVDLEEADGSQDIGRPAEGLLGGNFSNGSPFDFWWSGNNYRVITQGSEISLYNNEFSPSSTPDNSSNSGARSGFRFYDFSENETTAYFRLEKVTPEGSPELVLNEKLNLSNTYDSGTNEGLIPTLAITGTSNDILIPYVNGLAIYNRTTGDLYDTTGFTARPPLILDDNTVFGHFINQNEETVVIPFLKNGSQWSADPGITTSQTGGFLSSQNGDTLTLDGTTTVFSASSFSVIPNYYNEARQSSKQIGTFRADNLNSQIRFYTGSGIPLSFDKNNTAVGAYVGNLELSNGSRGFFIFDYQRLILVDPRSSDPFRVIYESVYLDWPAIVDWDRDGSLDFIFTEAYRSRITAVNSKGAVLNDFPITPSDNEWFKGTPLIADLDNDGELNLIALSRTRFGINTRIFNHEAKEMDYSPLYVGGFTGNAAVTLNPAILGDSLISLSHDGDLKGWAFPNMSQPLWTQKYGPAPYNKVIGELDGFSLNPQPVYQVLNQEETYNWPNPAEDETFIRFQVEEPGGRVDITIVNLSGQTVYRNTIQTSGGQSEEVRIDTSRLGSGGYYALVKANVNGRTESKLIKIAVIH